jgi:membrane protease YdiL (CAAX protease family)
MIVTTRIPGVRSLIRWEGRNFGGSYFTGILIVVLTFIATIMTRLDFEELGVNIPNWRKSLNMGLKGFLAFLVPQFTMTWFWTWRIDYRDYWLSAVVQGLTVLVFTFLLIGNIGSKKGDITRIGFSFIALILGIPLILSLTYEVLPKRMIMMFFWHILVGGFAEELLYRGYIQSTINRDFGKKWSVKGVNFGPGLLVSSILYGVSRGARTMNFGWGLYAFTLGIFYGLIREASGDILGPSSANALINGWGSALIRVLT